jgi:hypothetical protein
MKSLVVIAALLAAFVAVGTVGEAQAGFIVSE